MTIMILGALRRFRASGAFAADGAHSPVARRARSHVLPAVRTFSADAGDEVLVLNKQLLACISRMDFPAYAELMSDDISCFEPEAGHQQVRGKVGRELRVPSLRSRLHNYMGPSIHTPA